MCTSSTKGGAPLRARLSVLLSAPFGAVSPYVPSRWERRGQALAVALALTQGAFAQGGAAQALSGVQETIITIVQVLFSIILVIGLIRVVMKFVNGAPDALSSLGWLVGGVFLWFGFQFFKDDLVGTVGGEGGVR